MERMNIGHSGKGSVLDGRVESPFKFSGLEAESTSMKGVLQRCPHVLSLCRCSSASEPCGVPVQLTMGPNPSEGHRQLTHARSCRKIIQRYCESTVREELDSPPKDQKSSMQCQHDWLGSNRKPEFVISKKVEARYRASAYFGGCPQCLVTCAQASVW